MEIIKKTTHHLFIQCQDCGKVVKKDRYTAQSSRTGNLCNVCANVLQNMANITQGNLKSILFYNELTGQVTLIKDQKRKPKGTALGFLMNTGYLAINIAGKAQLLHRIIWFMQTGKWPEQIDHINHIRTDNRWCNIRNISPRNNQLNMSKRHSKLGIQGIRKLAYGSYQAYIMVNYKQISLGCYEQLEDAIAARKSGEKLYGFHPNHGK